MAEKQPLIADENGLTVEYESRNDWARHNGKNVKNHPAHLDNLILGGKVLFVHQIDEARFLDRKLYS